jgi:two-component system, NtrC family, nitrogen regulation sensor histidine kinase NtrY
MLKRLQIKILIRIALLFMTLFTLSFLLLNSLFIYVLLLAPVLIYQIFELFRFQNESNKELFQFIQSVRYRDFSRNFDVKHAPDELKILRESFNQINSTFKTISKQNETSYHYLQKILELVDTGILSYQVEDGEVIWMNESLKKMLQLPYLKTIHSLQKRDPQLYDDVTSLKATEGKIATAHVEKKAFKILLSATAFQTDGKKFMLIAFQNINEAVDETESKAWKKLLSVMTHEIMNSVAPISSLADTLKSRLEKSMDQIDNKEGAVYDLQIGIDTIKRRSESLLKFAEVYRNFNKINKPNLTRVYVRDLFENLYQLMEPTLEQKNIEMDIVLKDTGLMVDVDISLVEQVLINLLVNAIEAVKENPEARIILSADLSSEQKILIKIADNGAGIAEDVIENIFIPFFSTRKNGSGIGLSLCKEIMMLHKGNIQVQSKPEQGSVFTLVFGNA